MAALCARGRATTSPQRWLAALLLAFAIVPPAAAEPIPPPETVTITMDQARLLQLPDRAANVIVGNPLIADLSIQPGGLAVITGKGYGTTNFIVADKKGGVLMEKIVAVTGPTDKTVVVYRGVTRQTYSCAPECERRITLGDTGLDLFDGGVDKDYFTKTIEQTTVRNGQATGVSSQNAGR